MSIKQFLASIFKSPDNILLLPQWLLLLVLLSLIPYAMSFTPFEQVFEVGSYKANYAEDPLQAQRAFLISFGLIISFISFLFAIIGLFLKPRKQQRIIIQFAIALAALWIGWRTYPYWANGINKVYTPDFSMADRYSFDPKGLRIPAIWALPVFCISPAYFAAMIVLLILGIRYTQKNPGNSACIWVAVAMTGIIVLTYILSPGFFTWYID